MSDAGEPTGLSLAGCVFCDRIRTGDYEDRGRFVVSFEPLRPVTPGHRLFVHRLHTPDAAAQPWVTGAVFEAAAQFARGGPVAFNLITSCGAAATQTVRHLHVHYVPRRADDGLPLPWTGQT